MISNDRGDGRRAGVGAFCRRRRVPLKREEFARKIASVSNDVTAPCPWLFPAPHPQKTPLPRRRHRTDDGEGRRRGALPAATGGRGVRRRCRAPPTAVRRQAPLSRRAVDEWPSGPRARALFWSVPLFLGTGRPTGRPACPFCGVGWEDSNASRRERRRSLCKSHREARRRACRAHNSRERGAVGLFCFRVL
jgi:hypothetical protein